MKQPHTPRHPLMRIAAMTGIVAFVAFGLRCGGVIHISPDLDSDPPGPVSESYDHIAQPAPDIVRVPGKGARENWRQFKWSEPERDHITKRIQLWATNYYVPVFHLRKNAEALIRGTNERSLFREDGLTRAQWCDLALQGSARIRDTLGMYHTVSFAGRSEQNRISCEATISSYAIVEKIAGNRFEIVAAVYGRGSRVKDVIPFRTIAVDPNFIAHGSVVYIPAAKGQNFDIDGRTFVHDGYFFAGDSGSAIIGDHIDVFSGTESFRGDENRVPLGFITSSEQEKFDAMIIQNEAISSSLRSMHGFLRN